MKPEYDIHNRLKMLERSKEIFLTVDIDEQNRKLMKEFIQYKIDDSRISAGREEKLYCVLAMIGQHLPKKFKQMTGEDITKTWYLISQQRKRTTRKIKGDSKQNFERVKTDKKLTPWTIRTYGVIYKGLFKWLAKKKHISRELLDDIEEVKLPKKDDLIKAPRREHIIKWSEAVRMSLATDNTVYTALVQVLWESGARVGELLTLDYDNVSSAYNNRGLYLDITHSKNEQGKRSILIIDSSPALLEWMDKHPTKKGALFLGQDGSRLNYPASAKFIKRLAELIGLDKPVNPHQFRKSETSEVSDLTDAETKARHGWKQNSQMLNIYRNPDMKKADDKLAKARGIPVKEDRQEAKDNGRWRPRACMECGHLNIAGRDTCNRCKGMLKLDDRTKELIHIKQLDEQWDTFKKQNQIEAGNVIKQIADLLQQTKS